MSPSGKKPPGKKRVKDRSEEAGGEEMQVEQNQQLRPSNAAAQAGDGSSQGRGSSPGRFNFGDPFQRGDASNHQDNQRNPRQFHPSMFENHYLHARQDRDLYDDHQYFSSGASDPYSFQYAGPPGMHPSGMSSLDQTSPYDDSMNHGPGISRNQSFDLSSGFFSDHFGSMPYSDHPMPLPHNLDDHEGSMSEANISDRAYMQSRNAHHNHSVSQLNHESMEDQNPTTEDIARQQYYAQQGPTRRAYPTQDRNPQPPPSNAANRRDSLIFPPPYATAGPSYADSGHEGPSSRSRAGLRSGRHSNVPAAASLPRRRSPPRAASTRTSRGRKATPKKGPGTRLKQTRRSARSSNGSMMDASPLLLDHFHIPTAPSADELENARTPRKRQALITWYQRLAELVEYKLQHGHTNVPQQFDANHSLGIWVNKQRMEKKAMDAGEKSGMTPEKVRLLEKAGFIWAKRKGQAAWEEKFRELQQFQAQNGHCDVPTKNKKNRALGRWVSTQRSNYKKYKKGVGTLRPKTDEDEMERRIRCLEGIGFKWSLLPGSSSNEEDDEPEEDENDRNEEGEYPTDDSHSSPPKKGDNEDGNGGDGPNPRIRQI